MYYIGEMIGVIAVIASLINVGKHLRQNTKTMRVNAAYTYTQWQRLNWSFKNFGHRQSVRETWKVVKDGYDKSFQDFMNQYLE